MSDTLKWLLWLIALIFFVWFTVSVESCRKADYNGWEGVLCNDCAETTKENSKEPVAPIAESRSPIDFEVGSDTVFTNPGYEEYRRRILEGYKDGQILEITGDYAEGELAPSGFDNMGFARAAALRDLLSPDIPADRIILKSNLLNTRPDGYFKGHDYQWIAEKVEAVQEIDGCTIIRFAFNSSDGKLDATIVDRLNKIAERVRTTGENISIVGHTDNIGNPEGNLALGRSRARDIRRELQKRKVSLSQIVIDSKGMSSPVATNDTDRGRAENRRVEVCLSE